MTPDTHETRAPTPTNSVGAAHTHNEGRAATLTERIARLEHEMTRNYAELQRLMAEIESRCRRER